MKIALVHDYLNEFGGAEVVLRELADLFPEAPIYTAFAVPGSTAQKAFVDRKLVQSWFSFLPGYKKLYSPLRFLIPWIWSSFDLTDYDLIISSASWYITKGFKKKESAKEICYCHTPPRWLYGYETSVNWKKWRVVRIYAAVVGHFLRLYDFEQAQKVDAFVANSKNVANRIRKFYRRESDVIYPPVITHPSPSLNLREGGRRGDYYLIVSRLVGGKGIEMAVRAAKKGKFVLKIAGEFAGYKKMAGVETLGRVSEEEKVKLMSEARGFLALSKDEDFGITPVESQMCGTPVVAFRGGGYPESVVDGKTGVLFDEYNEDGLVDAITRFEAIDWNDELIRRHAETFSAPRFRSQMLELVARVCPNFQKSKQ